MIKSDEKQLHVAKKIIVLVKTWTMLYTSFPYISNLLRDENCKYCNDFGALMNGQGTTYRSSG